MRKYRFIPYRNLNIKNIIFDLGGVLLDISYPRMEEAFQALGVTIGNRDILTGDEELFNRFDCGTLTPKMFRDELRCFLNRDIPDSELDRAWNSLLNGWDKERIALLKSLKQHYNLFLLSNTNAIHYAHYSKTLKDVEPGLTLPALFAKTYLSFRLGMRKPQPEIFGKVISENNLIPENTLFIDDTKEHIDSARKLGINVHHYVPDGKTALTGLFERE